MPAAPPPRGVNSIRFLPLRARTAGERGFEVSALAVFPSHPLFLPREPSFQIIQPLQPESRRAGGFRQFHPRSIKLLLPS